MRAFELFVMYLHSVSLLLCLTIFTVMLYVENIYLNMYSVCSDVVADQNDLSVPLIYFTVRGLRQLKRKRVLLPFVLDCCVRPLTCKYVMSHTVLIGFMYIHPFLYHFYIPFISAAASVLLVSIISVCFLNYMLCCFYLVEYVFDTLLGVLGCPERHHQIHILLLCHSVPYNYWFNSLYCVFLPPFSETTHKHSHYKGTPVDPVKPNSGIKFSICNYCGTICDLTSHSSVVGVF